jgi:hypothetical protein
MFAALITHPIGLLSLLAGLGILGMATQGPVFPLGSLGVQAAATLLQGPYNMLSASGALNPHQSARYVVTKSTAAALTLGPPTSGADDGVSIQIFSTTAAAHTVTAPTAGQIVDGNSSTYNTVMTFNAKIGANCTLDAYQGKWYVTSETGCAMSS